MEKNVYSTSMHYFDSNFSSTSGHGGLFRYTEPVHDVVGWRVVDIILYSIPPAVTNNVFHMLCSLPTGTFSNHFNGLPKSVIGTVYRKMGDAPPYSIAKEWSKTRYISSSRITDFYFNVLNEDLQKVDGIRFLVILELFHCKNEAWVC